MGYLKQGDYIFIEKIVATIIVVMEILPIIIIIADLVA
jgi:hypothetical protein